MTSPDAGKLDFEDLDLAEWLKRHGRKASIATGVLAVLAVGTWLYVASARRKESFAAQELVRARSSAESGNLPLASADLSRLIERFGGTRAADEATIMLNQLRLLQDQRDVAVTALQEFVRGRHDDDIKASAYALLAGGLEDQGKLREAGEAYRQASARARLDFLKAGYLLDAGRTLAAGGDSAGAKTAYGEVLTRYPELDQAAEARVRLGELGGQTPDASKAARPS